MKSLETKVVVKGRDGTLHAQYRDQGPRRQANLSVVKSHRRHEFNVGAGSFAREISAGESRGEGVGYVEIENMVSEFGLMP
jgi:hypothetical protein